MSFTLILGPIKSAKSLELITQIMPYEIAGKTVRLVQPSINVRDDGVASRAGLRKASLKVDKLPDVVDDFDVVAIDEVHMFDNEADYEQIKAWVLNDKVVLAAGLDTDYSGIVTPAVNKLLSLVPDKVIYKRSVCEICSSLDGVKTQILSQGKIVTTGLPSVVPEDGTYEYRSVCRNCYYAGSA